jgi:signal transduction histidine kinase
MPMRLSGFPRDFSNRAGNATASIDKFLILSGNLLTTSASREAIFFKVRILHLKLGALCSIDNASGSRPLLMSGGIKFRLAAFVLAMAVMASLIAWLAHTSWRRTGELREKLSAVQLQSFQIAGHCQQSILELNNLVLRYGVYHEPNDWVRFEIASTNLDHWLDEQRPILKTEREKQILDRINDRYDDYVLAAQEIGARARAENPQIARLSDFEDFEAQSRNILGLSFELAQAHRDSLNTFLVGFSRSLTWLRYLTLGCLALLLIAGAGFAAVVYRDMIAPLRVKLFENEALLQRQEKLASLGMLAAGLAHEIRNPLTAIKAWLFIQQKNMTSGSQEHADAQVISNEVNRLERIVKDVLLFARPSEPQLAEVPAAEPLHRVHSLMAGELARSNIRLEVENSVSARVSIDSEQMQQVLINLVQNAAESIGKDGIITLRVKTAPHVMANGMTDAIVLEVADTGRGIAPEVERRLFDPFFTTKEMGTGLGLSIAARIVQKHGGALQYQTRPNHGATFGIVLPKAGA